MSSNATVNFINNNLIKYGRNQYGDPIFRVVFSDDQIEKRKGAWDKNKAGIIVKEIKEVKKYPWIKGRWIIERWAPGEISHHPDLETDKDGVYICVYVFQDRDGNYLPPILSFSEIFIDLLNHPRPKSQALAEDLEVEQKIEASEVDKIELDLKIQSDELRTHDKKAYRESSSVGYTKDKIKGE